MADGGTTFVGRESELSAIDEALSALRADAAGGILQVAGEPGIGKTRLLAELRARAEAAGCVVLSGRAGEFEGDLPFGIFVDAFDDYLAALGPERLAAVGPEWTPELATVFSAFSSLAGGRPPALQAERYRTYRAVRVLCDVLSRPRPLVVALDDVHWCDPASVELLSYLLAHSVTGRVLMVMAFRPVPTPPRLVAALAAAVRDGRARRLDLSPLSRADADRLAGPDLDAATRAALYRESGGNPFYLEQLARTAALEAGPGPALAMGAEEDAVPAPVATALASERNALAAPARTMLGAAAVVGDPFDADVAAQVAQTGPDEALELIDVLIHRDLVRPSSVPRRFRFRHPIVRRAVYESTGAGWRIAAHGRAAAALTAAGTPAPALAHHLERSARAGDEQAVATLIAAGHAAVSRAPATAARWYGAAMRLLGDDDPRALELLVARATALGAAGQLSESHAALEGALERLPPTAGSLRVQLTAFAARVEMLMGDARRARDRLVGALAQLGRADSIEAATLQVELGALGMFTSDFGPMRAYAEEALLISQRAGHRPLELVAAGLRAYAAGALVEPNAAEALARAAGLFDQTDDATLAQRLDAGIYLGWSEVLLERFSDSERHLRRALNLSRATGQGQFVLPLILGQLVPIMWQGRIVEAAQRTEAAVEAARLGASNNLQAWALFAQAWASTYAGQLERAIGLGEEVAALLRGRSPTVVSTAAKMFHGLALLEAGRAAQARRELLDALKGSEMPSYGATAPFELLTRTELALGNLPAAEEWAAQAETSARAGRLALQTCLAWRARAAVLIARGEFNDAADVALEAASAGERVRSAVEAARARVLAGQALARAGQLDRAITELQRAETTLTECGAAGFAAQATAELRRLGRRPVVSRTPAGVASPETLTQREREIATLVASGRTNREIAAACYLSEKTVEGHLSRIFAKWGISSRAALAGLISRQQPRRPGG